MNFPENLLYTQDHEWIAINGDTATVGITAFAQSELGDIVYVDINTVGQDVAKGEIFGTVEAVKTVSDLFLPISATILEWNEALNNSPELVNDYPYEQGWIVKIKIKDASEVASLLSAADYRSLIGK
jgi:glycine cleavage system H protein